MLSNLPTMEKSTFGLMELYLISINIMSLFPMIWITNMVQKSFKEILISLQFTNPNAQLSNGEKALKLET